MRFAALQTVSHALHTELHHIPKSLTSTALLFLRPVSYTLTSRVLGIGDPSLPFVTRRR